VRSLAEAFTGERPTPPVKDADDAIIETYLKHANITGHGREWVAVPPGWTAP
jgi:hypothetical protein